MSDNDTKTFSEIFFKAGFRVGKGMSNGLGLDESTLDAFETIEDVAASETGMDAVAASETARDAIRNSPTASDAVGASNLAIGKFAAGSAGLDPTDFADMDAVAASETAMDAVAASETAYAAILGVDFPKTVENAELTHEADRVRYTRQSPDGVEAGVGLAQSLSFDDKNTLKIKARADTSGDPESRLEAVVKIAGDGVLNLDGDNTDFAVRDVDVSEITGRELLELGFSTTDQGDDEPYEVDYGRFWLE